MKKLLRKYPVIILTTLALTFIAVIIGLYIWGIGYLIMVETNVEGQPTAANAVSQFNLDAAAKLDYRGALPASATQ